VAVAVVDSATVAVWWLALSFWGELSRTTTNRDIMITLTMASVIQTSMERWSRRTKGAIRLRITMAMMTLSPFMVVDYLRGQGKITIN
jgi:hypothetical protein